MRERLPARRASQVVAFDHFSPLGHPTPYTATIGYYEDWRIGEVFVDGKMGSEAGALANDAAILISIALQHGVPIEEMRAAMGRGNDGRPQSICGSVLDLLGTEAGATAAAGFKLSSLNHARETAVSLPLITKT